MPRSFDRQLADVLVEFAHTMVTDFPLEAILERLVVEIVDILPVDAAGVTLIDAGRLQPYVAASSASALRFERIHAELADSPCVACYETGDAISIPDLGAEHAYPGFATLALAAGFAAVFTFPLSDGTGRLGSLDLYSASPVVLGVGAIRAAQTLADVATAYLVNARTRAELIRSAAHATEATLHDALTGLPNRVLFMDRLRHAIGQCDRAGTVVTVLYIDLDDFKATNDTFGHDAGDRLLCAIADRLVQHCRPADTVARLAGDEFAVLYEHPIADARAEVIADRLRETFAAPFRVDEMFIEANASIGIAFTESSTAEAEDVLNEADLAMYQAKRRGGAHHTLFDHAEYDRHVDRAGLRRDLSGALGRAEITAVYQPIVATGSGLVVELEALVRWHSPARGNIFPAVVVELAEQTDLIHRIGQLMLTDACRSHGRWVGGTPGVRFAVNVSAHELMSPGFAHRVAATLELEGTDPSIVTFEVTESTLAHDGVLAVATCRDLKRLGIRIALDDFGTGYSSLSYLARFPLDVIKIDQSFVAGLGLAGARHRIVESVITLAHGLGMTVVAEGVETAEQRDALAVMNADAWQGFHYAPGLPANEIGRLLAGQRQ